MKHNPHVPFEFHRKERWSRGLVQVNRKKYTRKSKHKKPKEAL